MATNLKIDEELLAETVRIGGFKTKREAVNQVLSDYVRRHKQRELLEWEGKVDFFEDYDYKALRNARQVTSETQ